MTSTGLIDLSARDLAAAVRAREVSAREVLEAHFARIDAVNPAINAVVTQVREQAYAAAARADERTATVPAGELPPLHGVPMTHKDTH
ncbi:MAG: amidase family protein, partial [Actinomycetota bacterium]